MNSADFDLTGKTALVTGAAAGLGQAIAVGLAGAGATVLGTHHRRPDDQTRALIEARGRAYIGIAADLSDPESVGQLAEAALAQTGRVDILVNNAGIIRRADALESSVADWDAVLNVNLKSVFLLSQRIAGQMVARGLRGKLINIASMLSYQGGVRVPSYTASKHAVLGLTRALANEWAGRGINVNGIAPGYMATDNTQPLRDDPVRSSEILGRIPAGRWGRPEDLQGAAVFLASPASDYVHGCTIPVDGGWLAR